MMQCLDKICFLESFRCPESHLDFCLAGPIQHIGVCSLYLHVSQFISYCFILSSFITGFQSVCSQQPWLFHNFLIPCWSFFSSTLPMALAILRDSKWIRHYSYCIKKSYNDVRPSTLLTGASCNKLFSDESLCSLCCRKKSLEGDLVLALWCIEMRDGEASSFSMTICQFWIRQPSCARPRERRVEDFLLT